ncbi:hypothetical protein TNCV_1059711 [Trichonephila clavipes]|nr:hypothetical protein TNCV_1059711 [Trichonephila clavipes]
MLVRLSRAPVLSGGLRRKTQLFSPVPSTWSLPPRPHLTSPKILKFKTPCPSASFPGVVRCVIIPKGKKKNIRHNFIPLSPWSAKDFVAEK